MKKLNQVYVNFGCGIYAPDAWQNFDTSPTLRIRKIPIIGKIFSRMFHDIRFPEWVQIGNIVKGLPIEDNSVDVMYSSHVLEHLCYLDAQKAICNIYKHLKPGGIFRAVLPDLEILIMEYNKNKAIFDSNAANKFMLETLLGLDEKPKGILRKVISLYGNYHHLWMWDFDSLSFELSKAGFIDIKRCVRGDSDDLMLDLIEDPTRFIKALYIEAKKP